MQGRRILARSILVLAAGLLFACGAVGAQQLVVFGDSLSDVGNAKNAATVWGLNLLALGYHADGAGRFTSGPDTLPRGACQGVWHEVLARDCGLGPAQRSSAGGTNYAFGGATTDTSQTTVLGFVTLDNVGKQIADCTARAALPPDTLYLLWAGGNDIMNAANAGTDPVAAARTAETNLAQGIDDLWQHGARRFIWLNLPALDRTPWGRNLSGPQSAAVRAAVEAFNSQWQGDCAALKTDPAYAGGQCLGVDAYSLLNDVLDHPAGYGFTNTQDAATAAWPWVNADDYVFWDTVHPTAHTHAVLGNAIAALLVTPEPATLALLALGGLVLVRRRR